MCHIFRIFLAKTLFLQLYSLFRLLFFYAGRFVFWFVCSTNTLSCLVHDRSWKWDQMTYLGNLLQGRWCRIFCLREVVTPEIWVLRIFPFFLHQYLYWTFRPPCLLSADWLYNSTCYCVPLCDIMPQSNFHGKIYSALFVTNHANIGGFQLLITFQIWVNKLQLFGNWELLVYESKAIDQNLTNQF